MIRAAGIFFITKDGQGLFLKRSPVGDYEGYWCFPGGKIEDDETALEAAQRETTEEIGVLPKGKQKPWTQQVTPGALPPGDASPDEARTNDGAVDFTTFIQQVDEPFAVEINEEHTGWCWADLNSPPQPMHPGCQVAINRLTMDELGVARAMAAGQLVSPQRYGNMSMFAMRITGTGTAYRKALDEYVYRRPETYLTDEFLARCNGLPVIWVHPKGNVLNSQEFEDRIVGTVLLPYLQGDEVWGIAKIYDDNAIDLMETKRMSTSPAVVFHNPAVNETVTLDNGSTFLIEGKPSQIDHLAVCEVGVWDKGGEPAGVKSQSVGDSAMPDITKEEREKADAQAAADAAAAKADAAKADAKKAADAAAAGKGDAEENDDDKKAKEEKEKADAQAKADAESNNKLDKIISGIDSISARQDADSKRLDECVKRMDAYEEGTDPKKVAADRKARKDAEEDEEKKKEAKEKEDKDRADAAVKADAHVESIVDARIAASLPKPMTDEQRKSYVDTQSRWDKVANCFADSAPPPMTGESTLAYRKRLTGQYQKYCADWAKIDLDKLGEDALTPIESIIHKAAMAAALNPTDLPGAVMRERKERDDSGRMVSTFYGSPSTWMDQFKSSTRRVTGFNPNRRDH